MYILYIQYPWYMVDYVYPVYPELKTLECDILNHDRLINLEINNKKRASII